MKTLRNLKGGVGLLWVLGCLIACAGTVRVWRLLIDLMGWDVHTSRIQYMPSLCSKVSWLGYKCLGGCELTIAVPNATEEHYKVSGLHVVLWDHPNREIETPLAWIATWRLWDFMIGSFDAGHIKWWNPFAMGMWYTDMTLPVERQHKKNRKNLTDEQYAAQAAAAEKRFRDRLRYFDRLAGKIGVVMVLHLFVTSRWTKQRHEEDLVKYGNTYPGVHRWGKWVLVPPAGGFHACREELRGVTGWYMMAMPKDCPRGPDTWKDFDDIIGASYTVALRDVTLELNALPLTRDASERWLAERFAPWAAEQHELALRN